MDQSGQKRQSTKAQTAESVKAWRDEGVKAMNRIYPEVKGRKFWFPERRYCADVQIRPCAPLNK
jgi:hypothetical protein